MRAGAVNQGIQQVTDILVLYYSRHGATAELARQVVRGVESVAGANRAAAHRARGFDGDRGNRADGSGLRPALRHS